MLSVIESLGVYGELFAALALGWPAPQLHDPENLWRR